MDQFAILYIYGIMSWAASSHEMDSQACISINVYIEDVEEPQYNLKYMRETFIFVIVYLRCNHR